MIFRVSTLNVSSTSNLAFFLHFSETAKGKQFLAKARSLYKK